MKIHIVAPSDGWILDRWAQRWAQYLPATKSTVPDPSADVNFYVNYAMYQGATPSIDACYFTHKEEGGELAELFDKVAQECDLRIVQSRYTRTEIPANVASWIVHPGLDDDLQFDKIVGLVGREKVNGRKRYDFARSLDIPGIKIKIFDNVDYKDIGSVYEQIDYLLVTSTREGGPMCVAEAVGMGVPIIMPDGVGWSEEVPCITYTSDDHLIEILTRLGKWVTWQESSDQLRVLFERFMV